MRRSWLVGIVVSGLSVFASCEKDPHLQIRFLNETGRRVDDIRVNGTGIRDLQPGETSDYYQFETFGTDTGMPDADFSGSINKKRLSSTSFMYWCGTEKSEIMQGRYTIILRLVKQGTDEYFHLLFNN